VATAASILIGQAIERVLTVALADLEMPVERERYTPLTPRELPRVVVLEDDDGLEEVYVGGAALRVVRLSVECYADGATAAHSMSAIATLRDRCRVAIEADRTLGGACLSLEIGEGDGSIGGRLALDVPEKSVARSHTTRVNAYYATQPAA